MLNYYDDISLYCYNIASSMAYNQIMSNNQPIELSIDGVKNYVSMLEFFFLSVHGNSFASLVD